MPKQSHIISTVLSPALRLWLRSQVEHVEHLQVKIEGGDRQILAGQIQQVLVAAQQVVYQGLHLSQIQLVAQGIQINLGPLLRGQPLQLREPIPVEGELRLQAADLNASLQTPMLAGAVAELLTKLLQAGLSDLNHELLAAEQPDNLQNLEIDLDAGQLTLSATLLSANNKQIPLVIRTALKLVDGHKLLFEHPQWLTHRSARRGLPLEDLEGFTIDLGPDVDIRELVLEKDQVLCQGRITVFPAEPELT